MKELYLTNEMQKFQTQAKDVFAKTKKVDISAVYLGWKIAPGRVLYDASQEATITLLEEPQRHLFKAHFSCQTKGLDRDAEINITQIGSLILNNKVVVYYSK